MPKTEPAALFPRMSDISISGILPQKNIYVADFFIYIVFIVYFSIIFLIYRFFIVQNDSDKIHIFPPTCAGLYLFLPSS